MNSMHIVTRIKNIPTAVEIIPQRGVVSMKIIGSTVGNRISEMNIRARPIQVSFVFNFMVPITTMIPPKRSESPKIEASIL